jgi:antibiotic biosynthesis monooxygenase (ABM) superfamily enzyme
MAIIYIVIFIWTMPAFPPEIKNTPLFNLILVAVLIIIAVIPNIVIGVIGGLFAVFLKTAPKSKGITSKEISKKLKKRKAK